MNRKVAIVMNVKAPSIEDIIADVKEVIGFIEKEDDSDLFAMKVEDVTYYCEERDGKNE